MPPTATAQDNDLEAARHALADIEARIANGDQVDPSDYQAAVTAVDLEERRRDILADKAATDAEQRRSNRIAKLRRDILASKQFGPTATAVIEAHTAYVTATNALVAAVTAHRNNLDATARELKALDPLPAGIASSNGTIHMDGNTFGLNPDTLAHLLAEPAFEALGKNNTPDGRKLAHLISPYDLLALVERQTSATD